MAEHRPLEPRIRVRIPGAQPLDGRCNVLWMLVVVILILWALGLAFEVAGGLIHLLLVVALIVIVYRLLTGRRG